MLTTQTVQTVEPLHPFVATLLVTNPHDCCGVVERLIRVQRPAASPADFIARVNREWRTALGPHIDVDIIGHIRQR